MKKFLIVLLAALLLVSFTSCDNQKKIDEAVAKKEAETKESLFSFLDTSNAIGSYSSSIKDDDCTAGTYNLSDFESDDETKKGAAKTAICMLLASSNSSEYRAFVWGPGTVKISSATGTVKIEKSEDGTTCVLEAEGVSIKASYTPSSNTYEHYEKIEDATLTLDGTIYNKDARDKKTGEGIVDCKATGFKQNGVSYKDIEYSESYTKESMEFTKALCDGKNVDCEILNKIYNVYNY